MASRSKARSLTPYLVTGMMIVVWSTPVVLADVSGGPEVTSVKPSRSMLGRTVTLKVKGLKEWKPDRSKLVLFLNNRPIPNITPTFVNSASEEITFELERKSADEGSRKAWATVLADPIDVEKTVPVSVGTTADGPIPSEVQLTLDVIPRDWFLVASAAVFLFSLVLFFWLVRVSNIIRDSGPSPGTNKRRPYSLGRTQMAFWFFLVMACFLLIWVVTRDRDAIPASVLTLMGISAGTALGAVLIDSSKRTTAESEFLTAQAHKTTLQQSIVDLNSRIHPAVPPVPPPSTDVLEGWKKELQKNQDELALTEQRIQTLSATLAASESKGFVKDILSDADGISLHRFQIFVWTVALGIVFIASVVYSLAMPTFSETLLALLGISGVTYLGFKFPEPKR